MNVAGDFLREDFIEFAEFGRGLLAIFELDLLIVQGERVADEAHFDHVHQKQFALFGCERTALGGGDQLGEFLFELVVGVPLFIAHFNEEIIVSARR